MALPIIYINSWPGVVKHTIANEIEKQMEGIVRVVSEQQQLLGFSRLFPISFEHPSPAKTYLLSWIPSLLGLFFLAISYTYQTSLALLTIRNML